MIWENLFNKVRDLYIQLTLEQKRLLLIIGVAGFCVVLTIAVFLSVMKNLPEKTEKIIETEQFFIIDPIPAEEIFLPPEPDFLPGVVLDRERRSEWTARDAEEFWQDPLREGEEQWRQKITDTINEFLESVP